LRDTRAEIVGRGTTEKIAHAYAYGGPNMAVKSLEKLMNVPIDHYGRIMINWHIHQFFK
jgi:anionic cell wall polymer biosynthesis LytR-Cps2A-Psr (LCP) family protein